MSTDGLSLEQVQQQWTESQRLIDDLRTRLEALASASTSAAEAASRARESQESLAGLVDVQRQVLEKFRELQASAADAVQQLQAASNSNDTSQLIREMSSVADAAGRAAQASSTSSDKVDGLGKDMASRLAEQDKQLAAILGDLAELRKTQTKVADLETRIRELEFERDRAQGDLRKAIAAVPGRYANKINDAVGRSI